MWEARVDFMRAKRGWQEDGDLDVEKLDLEGAGAQDPRPDNTRREEDKKHPPQTDVDRRLEAVEGFYRRSLPHLQSVIIVLLKATLYHIGGVHAASVRNGLQPGFQEPNGAGHPNDLPSRPSTPDEFRTSEVACKAITATILLMLKWFKLSRKCCLQSAVCCVSNRTPANFLKTSSATNTSVSFS